MNMTEKEVPMDYICKPVNPGHTIIPDKRSIKSLVSLCQKFHGRTSVVTSRAMEEKLAETFYEHEDSCQRWSGKLQFNFPKFSSTAGTQVRKFPKF